MVETFYTKMVCQLVRMQLDYDNRFNVTSTSEDDEFHKYYVENNYSTAKLLEQSQDSMQRLVLMVVNGSLLKLLILSKFHI